MGADFRIARRLDGEFFGLEFGRVEDDAASVPNRPVLIVPASVTDSAATARRSRRSVAQIGDLELAGSGDPESDAEASHAVDLETAAANKGERREGRGAETMRTGTPLPAPFQPLRWRTIRVRPSTRRSTVSSAAADPSARPRAACRSPG
jgi:hypothetical protein